MGGVGRMQTTNDNEVSPLDPIDQQFKEMWQSGDFYSKQPIEDRLKKWIKKGDFPEGLRHYLKALEVTPNQCRDLFTYAVQNNVIGEGSDSYLQIIVDAQSNSRSERFKARPTNPILEVNVTDTHRQQAAQILGMKNAL